MVVNLSWSISIEVGESVSWSPSISSPFYLFRFRAGFSAELELDERSERFDMSTSSQINQCFQLPGVLMLKDITVAFEHRHVIMWFAIETINFALFLHLKNCIVHFHLILNDFQSSNYHPIVILVIVL